MCTVTYIPDGEGFQLTSNRDEHISRGQAIAPQRYGRGKNALLYPKDADKKGSWIAAKNNGDLVVLLNGAFVKHPRQPAYRRSRGLILMDIISAEDPEQFYRMMNLYGIEPFTMVLHVSGRLYECRWDGGRKRIAMLDNKMAYIWSSVTLYDEVARAKRVNWFNDWRNSENAGTPANIVQFHRHGGEGDLQDGLIINRDGKMKTMSITNIRATADDITMTYNDLKDDKQYVNKLSIAGHRESKKQTALPRFLGLKSLLTRLFNWEYWPFNVVYAPIMFYWFWLSFKAKSFFFFNTANPLIENGGFAMESKWLIYKMLPREHNPQTHFFKHGTSVGEAAKVLDANNVSYPLIAKPDIGGRGILVKKVHNTEELADYMNAMKVDFLLQEYVPYKNEVGIFYYRMPGEEKGHISGIVGKEFLSVTGDGTSTIAELLFKQPRHLLQLKTLIETEGELLQTVLRSGETKVVVPYGNHARGAKFIDLSHLITDELDESIDKVCRQIPEFYFGRMDVMYNTWDELSAGRNFSIVELNGAGSEPTHIYDPKHSIFFAWREIIRHWKLLAEISRGNHNKGLRYMTYAEGRAMLKSNTEYLKLVS